ncbi:acetylornithine transaminase [Desulfallas thermosapovorans]|uniref:Acetylornithine aminotransferase n=1 Tax=Desulfallas thermosapovorans DSM 6562 TaxID=1121431 RepID=A0A5S4ZQU1_9FIRM|nr:acetylornithine transaminase [Desulfallas thermosapovorans]TYO94442.1 acetylornithine/N-succinyldiaminopimelate aminotransferase [Desulfallas thermosapovorans DSM 6562]
MNTSEIMQLSDKYVMHTYGRIGLAPVRGRGALLWDAEGREYLDFVAGIAVNSLGHCHPAVVQAVQEQVARLLHVSNLYYIENQARLAEILVQNSCADRVFFCNSGAEANEGAIKLARKWAKKQHGPQRYEIITAENSFHGRTLAAITATGQPKYQKGYEPLPEGFKYVPFNDLEALSRAIGPHTCAIMLEPVQGESGVRPATREYLSGVRELCDKHGLLLIFDEVQCGLGRTGKFLAYQHYDVEPDIFTLAKALGGGFPTGAMLAREEVANAFGPGDHAATFGGNPLACAAGLAAMWTTLNDGVLENCNRVGAYFKEKLHDLAGQYDLIKEVRGLGLMLGMELTVPGGDIVNRCRERGLLINCANNTVLRFVPPLIITPEDVDRAVEILDGVLQEQ